MKSTLAAGLAALALVAPPLNHFLAASMARHVLVQMPALVVLGFLLGRRIRGTRLSAADPAGLAGLLCLVGAIAFWLLPRSLDLAVQSDLADQLMHLSLLGSGALFASGSRRLPFAVRGTAAILGVSMLFALGAFYSRSFVLVCSAYTLEIQQSAGRAMIGAGIVAFFLVLIALVRELLAEGRLEDRGET